jgi:hypothetical protein
MNFPSANIKRDELRNYIIKRKLSVFLIDREDDADSDVSTPIIWEKGLLPLVALLHRIHTE